MSGERPVGWWWSLPELRHPAEVRMVRISGFYDRPLSGEATHDGRRVWFRIMHDDLPDYGLYEVPADRWIEHDRRTALFERHVGTHWSVTYDANGRRSYGRGATEPESSWSTYYDAAEDWPPMDMTAGGEPFARFTTYPTPHCRRARSRRYWTRRLAPSEPLHG